jgi:hypothetical protein
MSSKRWLLAFILLLAANTQAGTVRLQPKDVVGNWISLRKCSDSLWKFTADAKYYGYCFDMLEAGRWSLRGGDRIVITYYDDILKETVSAKLHRKTITITRFEPHSDRTFIYVRYPDGTQDKWMK